MTVEVRNLLPSDAMHVAFESSTDLSRWLERADLVSPAADQSGVPAGFTRYLFHFNPIAEVNSFVRLRLNLD